MIEMILGLKENLRELRALENIFRNSEIRRMLTVSDIIPPLGFMLLINLLLLACRRVTRSWH